MIERQRQREREGRERDNDSGERKCHGSFEKLAWVILTIG
jgi:hypothetical protein